MKSGYIIMDKIDKFYNDNKNYKGDDLRIKSIIEIYKEY